MDQKPYAHEKAVLYALNNGAHIEFFTLAQPDVLVNGVGVDYKWNPHDTKIHIVKKGYNGVGICGFIPSAAANVPRPHLIEIGMLTNRGPICKKCCASWEVSADGQRYATRWIRSGGR